ncbi:MAG: sulfatase-like hydrolase/transferase [Candidatus Hydrogenedentes bacterium]|nr:sulfatase-like hydrolase/transferase [Candidatus Hydrogenedentota bacterium]
MSVNRPHVLIITMDELRKDAFGCYGSDFVATPNIDRIAQQGIVYDRAYAASPICLPSRAAIATGLYPHNNGTYSNVRDCPLNPELPNIYKYFRDAGYTTAHIGKCHYSSIPIEQIRPDQTLPYDKFRNFYLGLGIDHLDLQDDKNVSVWFKDDFSKELDEAGYLDAYRAAIWDRSNMSVFDFPGPDDMHPDAWVGRKARSFMESRDPAKPLFMWVSFSGPHWPFDPPSKYLDRVRPDTLGPGRYQPGEFDDPRRIHYSSYHGPCGIDACLFAPDNACKNFTDDYLRSVRHHYYANVALIDDEIGAILDLANEQFGENILIIVTCDHGEMLGNHRLWGKNNCGYEDVLNIPFIVKMPGTPAPGRSDEFVSHVDVLPTCLAAADIDQPRSDGRNLAEPVAEQGRKFAFSESENFIAITDGRYKYIHFRRDGVVMPELFDLRADPDEFVNLAHEPDYAEIRTRLQSVIIELFMDALIP